MTTTDRVIMVRESEWREMREALAFAAKTLERTANDTRDGRNAATDARAALAKADARVRAEANAGEPYAEVCVNCGATRVLEVPDTKGPYEARFVDGGMPSDCCEYGVISLSEGREVCRVWREQDARAIASALSALTAGGDDG